MSTVKFFPNSFTMNIPLLTIVELRNNKVKYGQEIRETMLLMNNFWF